MQRLNDLQDTNGVNVNLHVLASAADFNIQAIGGEDELAILKVPVESLCWSGHPSTHAKLNKLLIDWLEVLPCKLLILGTSAATLPL